jgi:hypothetical protein
VVDLLLKRCRWNRFLFRYLFLITIFGFVPFSRLTLRVPVHLIAGLVVGEASQVLYDATTAFILRLFRRAKTNQSQLGFIKVRGCWLYSDFIFTLSYWQ